MSTEPLLWEELSRALISPTFKEAIRRRLALTVLTSTTPERFDNLLRRAWWPTRWRRADEKMDAARGTGAIADAITWYQMLVHDGWSPVRWEHVDMGAVNYVNGKWDGEIPADKIITAKKTRRWPIGFGPVHGMPGDVKDVDASMCGVDFRVLKIVMAEQSARATCCAQHADVVYWRDGYLTGQSDVKGDADHLSKCGDLDGTATEIVSLLVGDKDQHVSGMTKDFPANSLHDVSLPVMPGYARVVWRVRFIREAVWWCTFVVEEIKS